LTLRGIFTLRRKELAYFYQGPGTNFLFPDCKSRGRSYRKRRLLTIFESQDWEEYVKPIPEEERGDFITAY
jgi:proline iminopeptidase